MTGRATRPAAVAGSFYPGGAATLRKMLDEFLAAATLPAALPGQLRAMIAPHAGYIYSGPIAAYSFKALAARPPAGPARVFLMGPAHYLEVPGVALGNFGAFATPLGTVPVDCDTVAALLDARPDLYLQAPMAHEPEHCLEVELPFLQHSLSDFRLVPMLFGRVDPAAVAQDLHERLAPGDLVVVSSDLSHYKDYARARDLDAQFLDAVVRGDLPAAARGEACGRLPILALMGLAQQRGWTPVLCDARSSGDTAGDRSRVVGYASVVYYDNFTE